MSDHTDSDKYKSLLESTKAIPWTMDWQTKAFTYIGPQIEELLGWHPDSWVSAQDWIDRIHTDYKESVSTYCIAQSENGIDHEADYPALTADGNHIWIREFVHIIRKNGVTTELVGFMFDISKRKKLEDELVIANKKLEAYSYQDGLTGTANRRLYDQTLKSEWARALRSQQPISMIIIDIDHFKEYNDNYGHVAGDQCLKQIATVLSKSVTRSVDLCARYGGEEFVLLLPELEQSAARNIAEKVRKAVLDLKIPHKASATNSFVTISQGVSTLIPFSDQTETALFKLADVMLYQAKQNNRNCVAYC